MLLSVCSTCMMVLKRKGRLAPLTTKGGSARNRYCWWWPGWLYLFALLMKKLYSDDDVCVHERELVGLYVFGFGVVLLDETPRTDGHDVPSYQAIMRELLHLGTRSIFHFHGEADRSTVNGSRRHRALACCCWFCMRVACGELVL